MVGGVGREGDGVGGCGEGGAGGEGGDGAGGRGVVDVGEEEGVAWFVEGFEVQGEVVWGRGHFRGGCALSCFWGQSGGGGVGEVLDAGGG